MRIVSRISYRSLRLLQRLKPYRFLGRKLLRRRVRCRVATTEDASALSRIYRYEKTTQRGVAKEEIVRSLEFLRDQGYTLVASVGRRIVGAMVIRRFPDNMTMYPDWWIFSLQVQSTYRGLGLGGKIVRLALEKAAANGAARVSLQVFEDNRAAVNLYLKMGFRLYSIPDLDAEMEKEFRQTGRRRIIMSIELDQSDKIHTFPTSKRYTL